MAQNENLQKGVKFVHAGNCGNDHTTAKSVCHRLLLNSRQNDLSMKCVLLTAAIAADATVENGGAVDGGAVAGGAVACGAVKGARLGGGLGM